MNELRTCHNERHGEKKRGQPDFDDKERKVFETERKIKEENKKGR